jgi:Raf kinase inhibitor-like YbhB/YbcL family protein
MKKACCCILLLMLAHLAVNAQISVTSTAFTNNGMIPSKYSCEGDNTNPPLAISHLPANTKTLALICHDPDAPREGGFTHWVMWNINPNEPVTENFKGATQGANGTGKPGYIGMCPPSGTHHYHFMVYALDTKLNLDKSTDKAALETAMKGHILSQTDLVGLYKKVKN